jgi:hypothetical protein
MNCLLYRHVIAKYSNVVLFGCSAKANYRGEGTLIVHVTQFQTFALQRLRRSVRAQAHVRARIIQFGFRDA